MKANIKMCTTNVSSILQGWIFSAALLTLVGLTPFLADVDAATAGGQPTGAESSAVGGWHSGVQVEVPPTDNPPPLTAEQLREQQRMMQEKEEFNRSILQGLPIYEGPLPGAAGQPTEAPGVESSGAAPVSPDLPADPAVFRQNIVPFLGVRQSVVEPSIDGSGKMTFLTGNVYAARSDDNGATWSYIDPFADYGFGTNFCCDQLTVYDAGRDRQFWLRQYNDRHLEVSNSAGKDLVNWCTYAFYPADFGLPPTAFFDFNHMALSTRYLYVSTNAGNTAGTGGIGALVFRIPIDEQVACATLTGGRFFGPRTTEQSNALVNGAGDTMYWGTNLPTLPDEALVPGSGFRVFRWPDNSDTVEWFDRSITPYAFMFFNSGQNCGSESGVVLNWCERLSSVIPGNGYIAFPSLAQRPFGAVSGPDNDAVLGFAFHVKQDTSHPRPYIRRIYFRVSDLAYLGRSELWNEEVAILYPDMATNARGHVGIVWAWGGGTGTNNYFPGYGYTIDDDISPLQPWFSSFLVFGAGNACLSFGELRRWGDYLSIHAFAPSRLAWIATGFRMNAPTEQNCVSGDNRPQAEVQSFVFGRLRDQPNYDRGTTY